jgi:RNA polymerase sigma factor (sigma-70 family)
MALSRDAGPEHVRRDDEFELLHARHQAAVLAFCRHLTGSREDAEDAVQHTFLAAYRRIADGDETTDWRPWLFTVARNRCLTLVRSRRGEGPLVDSEAVAAVDGLAIEVERRQELRDLVRDMARLPEPQRAALVLSQLDALSYREIGTVLDVAPEKVKALVFQARSSLASAREARDAPCVEIRREIATARGSALRRRLLRRHVGQCDGCREFEVALTRQRQDLGILLPVAPSAGLARAILGGAGREGAATASAGGAALASGGTGAGLVGSLAALGAGGAVKLAVVVAIAGSSAAGALAADLPARIEHAAPWSDRARDRAGNGPAGAAPVTIDERRDSGSGSTPGEPGDGGGAPSERAAPRAHDGERSGDATRLDEPVVDEGAGVDAGPGQGGAGGQQPEQGGGDRPPGATPQGLPPGLAKRDTLPPGLAKRDELPPGLAKRDGAAPGRSGKAPASGQPAGSPGNGNSGGSPGNSGGQANGGGQGNGGGPGNGNANAPGGPPGNGAPGNSGGSGAVGQGNGNANGGGNGNAGGGGNGNGNPNAGGNGNAGNGNGNGGGNPH